MLPAGAADGDGDIAAAVGLVVGQPAGQVVLDILVHGLHFFLALEKGRHLSVLSGQRPQVGLPVGVRQAAGIEHQIGIHRNAVFEAEGLELDGHGGLLGAHHPVFDQVAQFVQVEMAGVQYLVCGVPDRLQQVLLLANRFLQVGIPITQWVLAAGFAEALHEHGDTGVQEQDVNRDMGIFQGFDHVRKDVQVLPGVAHIDTDGEVLVVAVPVNLDLGDQCGQQAHRQVVDAVIADVFEYVQRRTFSGAGEATDNDQVHGADCPGNRCGWRSGFGAAVQLAAGSPMATS